MIFQKYSQDTSIEDSVANVNFAVCASYSSQRLQQSTMDFDRLRSILGANIVETQNEQNRAYHLLSARLLKDIVD